MFQPLVGQHLVEMRMLGHNAPDRRAFDEQGFLLVTSGLESSEVTAARQHLTKLFQGEYDRGVPPTKPLRQPSKSFEFPSEDEPCALPTKTRSKQASRTQQLINAWHADSFFQRLCTSDDLGELVARVSGWEHRGCRLAQDQVWVKPPGAGPLTFHRDTTYFDMIPKEVTTVWFTFDDLDEELGPLEYCVGSHLWSDARRGSANQFFDPDYQRMLRDAAARELTSSDAGETLSAAAADADELTRRRAVTSATQLQIVSTVSLRAGGFSIHCGKLWHGSGPNVSCTRYRRGLGIHYVPGDARLNLNDLGSLWARYAVNGSDELSEEFFPWVYRPSQSEVSRDE